MQAQEYKPGSLVRVRNREWVVLPSNDTDLVMLKPLGGSEEEITGIYLPLAFKEDRIESAEFPLPGADDIGDISTARHLYNAARLSFRNGAGPFRSLAKLSFRPRSYQMVPLIMALKQEPVRLFIADDVGVGKTIEALLVVKELLERREIKRFAIVCLPHLCDQWQAELRDKFGIDAVIIRSNTQARLDRQIHGDTSVYDYYPYQVISIDYIKSDSRRQVFVQQCPELVVVDEAHTCARPSGAQKSQQQRHSLVYDIAKKPGQHLILITATPHSGKPEEFRSLLGLIKPEFENIDLPNATTEERAALAKHFIKRRRADVQRWMDEETKFPERDSGEFEYTLGSRYRAVYEETLSFAQRMMSQGESMDRKRRVRYWTALALLRGVMSSPAAGCEMFKTRLKKAEEAAEAPDEEETNPIMDEDYGGEGDFTPTQVMERTDWTAAERKSLVGLAESLESLKGIEQDAKARELLKIIDEWVAEGFHPVIFCRYIATANYLGEVLKPEIRKKHKDADVQVITSEDPDELRKERIEGMGASAKRILIATDCLSEGINLQEYFTAVLHYDLPWNPNRLEQREGRVDRFGQEADKVKAFLYYSKSNPVDGVVFNVILRKVKEIRRSIGISIPFPEDSKSIMDAVLNALLLKGKRKEDDPQLLLDFGEVDEVQSSVLSVSKAYEEAAAREKISHSLFAQHAVKAHEIEKDLKQTDEAIGDPAAVRDFVTGSLTELLGAQIKKKGKGQVLYTTNLPPALRAVLPEGNDLMVSFDSPTPEGCMYLGRNHLFVEQLCQYLMAKAIEHDHQYGPSRASVIRSKDVDEKTTALLFRVRNVIEEREDKRRVVAEEMILWGYRGAPSDGKHLSHDETKSILMGISPSGNITPEAQKDFLVNELKLITPLNKRGGLFDEIAMARAEALVEAHDRFRRAMGGAKYQAVKPVLPMDVMGIYIILPDKSPPAP